MKRVLMIIAFIGVTFFLQRIINKRNAETLTTIEEIETGRIRWDEAKMEEARQQALDFYSNAKDALVAGKLLNSYRQFAKARSVMIPYVDGHRQKATTDSISIEKWYNLQETQYKQSLIPAFENELTHLITGDVSYPYIKQVASWFKHKGIPELQTILDKQFEMIARERARNAPSWVRVTLPYSDDTYNQLLRTIIKEKFSRDYGKKVIYGYPMNHLEKRATWKTIIITKKQTFAYYQDRYNKNNWSGHSPQVPETLTLTFKVEGTKEIPTSWDKLDPLKVIVKVPKSILVRDDLADGGSEAKRVVHEAEVGLLDAMTEQLNALTAFTLFPGIDPREISVFSNNKVNMADARMMAFVDRPRLLKELYPLEQTQNQATKSQFAILCISLNLSEKADKVANILPTLKRRELDNALKELQKKPWYGDFKPFVALLKKLPHNQTSSYVTSSLDGQLHHKPLRDALVSRLESAPEHTKGNYIHSLMRSLEASLAREYAEKWMRTGSDKFSKYVFNSYRNNHKVAAYDSAVAIYKEQPDRVLSWLSLGRGFDPSKHTTGWDIIRAALKKKEYQNWAFELARLHTTRPEAWDIVDDILTRKPFKIRNASYIQQRLVYGAREAHPDIAYNYLLSTMKNAENKHLRESAMSQLFDGNEDKQAICEAVVKLLSERQNHQTFIPKVLNAINRYKSKEGWDFDNNYHLNAIMISATRHKNKRTRKSAHRMLGSFIKRGHLHFRGILEQAIQEEPIASQRQAAQKYLTQ